LQQQIKCTLHAAFSPFPISPSTAIFICHCVFPAFVVGSVCRPKANKEIKVFNKNCEKQAFVVVQEN